MAPKYSLNKLRSRATFWMNTSPLPQPAKGIKIDTIATMPTYAPYFSGAKVRAKITK